MRPASEFSTSKSDLDIVSKRNTMLSRYLGSNSREVVIAALCFISLFFLWRWGYNFKIKLISLLFRLTSGIPQVMWLVMVNRLTNPGLEFVDILGSMQYFVRFRNCKLQAWHRLGLYLICTVKIKQSGPGLPDWPFLGKISKIWPRFKLVENFKVILKKWPKRLRKNKLRFQLTASLIENLWLEVNLRI